MFGSKKSKNSQNKIFAQNEFWIRLVTLLIYAGTCILRDIFHNPMYGGKSRDQTALYTELSAYQITMKGLLKKKVLNNEQYDKVYPKDKKTNSELFDITLFIILIINCTSVSPPVGKKGWEIKLPQPHDMSMGANILRLRHIRNILMHCSQMSFQEFIDHWNNLTQILKSLGYDVRLVKDLKTGSLNNLDTFKIAIIQAKTKHLEICIETLSEGINENEKFARGLHLQQGVLSNDIQVINDIVKDISVDTSNLESTQEKHGLEIDQLKNKLQAVLQETEDIDMKLRKSTFDYGICLATTNYVLRSLIDTNFRKMETDIVELKQDLQDIKDTGIKQFPTETFSKRLEETSKMMKKSKVIKYNKECAENPFAMQNGEKKFFVDLILADSNDLEEDFNITDREHFIEIQSTRTESIQIENLINFEEDGFVVLRGSAGVGKSVLTNHLTYFWSKYSLWKEIKFVFHFTCRELNSSKASNFQQLLRECYQTLFNRMHYLELQEISNQILVIIDGIDEFVGISDFESLCAGKTCTVLPITKCLYNILCQKEELLSESCIIVSGRPQACSTLQNCLKGIRTKFVDVLGFSATSVTRYVNQFFSGDQTQIDLVKNNILENANTELMTRIPVYLWVICSLYKSKEIFDLPKTVTELYILELLLFMKKHFRGLEKENFVGASLLQVAESRKVCQVILDLAVMSFKMIERSEATFKEDADVVSCCKSFEVLISTGMITEVSTILGKKYQFFHLSMQEFLAAIHVMVSGFDMNDLYHRTSKKGTRRYSDKLFRGVLPIAFGLQGSEMHDPGDTEYLPQVFMSNIRKTCTVNRCSSLSINRLLKTVHEKAGKLSCMSETNEYRNEYQLFFNCYYEYQHKLERDAWLKGKGGVYVSLDLKLPIHLKHLLYFLNTEIKRIEKLIVNVHCTHDSVFSANADHTLDIKKNLIQKILCINRLEIDDETLTHLPLYDLLSTSSQLTSSSYQHSNFLLNRQPNDSLLSSSLNVLDSQKSAFYEISTTNKILLKELEIFVSGTKAHFDRAWLQIPDKLILKCAFSLEVLLESLSEWQINNNCLQMQSLHLDMLETTDDSIGHILALLNIFYFVKNVFITLNHWVGVDLNGFATCREFINDLTEHLKPGIGSLKILELNLRSEKHVYFIELGSVTCSRCNDGVNCRKTPYYMFDDFRHDSDLSNQGSINSAFSMSTGDEGRLIQDDEESNCCKYKKKIAGIGMGVLVILLITGLLMLKFFFHIF